MFACSVAIVAIITDLAVALRARRWKNREAATQASCAPRRSAAPPDTTEPDGVAPWSTSAARQRCRSDQIRSRRALSGSFRLAAVTVLASGRAVHRARRRNAPPRASSARLHAVVRSVHCRLPPSQRAQETSASARQPGCHDQNLSCSALPDSPRRERGVAADIVLASCRAARRASRPAGGVYVPPPSRSFAPPSGHHERL